MDDPCDLCPAFLRADEVPVFMEMSDGELVWPAERMAEHADYAFSASDARKAFKRFRELGLARSGALFSEDDGRLCGQGTWLTRLGFTLQDIMRKAMSTPTTDREG